MGPTDSDSPSCSPDEEAYPVGGHSDDDGDIFADGADAEDELQGVAGHWDSDGLRRRLIQCRQHGNVMVRFHLGRGGRSEGKRQEHQGTQIC